MKYVTDIWYIYVADIYIRGNIFNTHFYIIRESIFI